MKAILTVDPQGLNLEVSLRGSKDHIKSLVKKN
jgi:hypothetical protein